VAKFAAERWLAKFAAERWLAKFRERVAKFGELAAWLV
jgi:hypothetical protein